MKSNKIKPSLFIITGMHRSGTSLTASLFKSMGVDLGQRLMGPGPGNIKGHFEDLDLVEFHQTILRSQCLNDSGWVWQEKIEIEEQYVDKAKEIISKKPLNSLWGWKDPRTTLFLDFWAELLPDANFVLVFRSPWEVVDSLYRRGILTDEIFLQYPDLAVKFWIYYNKKIIEFYNKFPARCVLFSISRMVQQIPSFVKAVNEKFQVSLVTPAAEVYEKSLLHLEGFSGHRPTLVNHYFPEALDIYKELSQRETQLDEGFDYSWLEKIKSSPYRVWAFQDWVDICNLKRQTESHKGELERVQFQHAQVQAELQQVQVQLQQTLTDLEQSQFKTRSSLIELERTQLQLQQTQDEIRAMQTSKFWQLRTQWFKLKRFVALLPRLSNFSEYVSLSRLFVVLMDKCHRTWNTLRSEGF